MVINGRHLPTGDIWTLGPCVCVCVRVFVCVCVIHISVCLIIYMPVGVYVLGVSQKAVAQQIKY